MRRGWLCASVLAACVAARAQFPEHPHPIALSAQAEAKLTTLAGLEMLPADTWRVHTGDLPHGEAVALDDAAWPEAKPDSVGSTEAMWFRRTITVPERLNGYDLTGAKISFAFDIWAEGPVPVIVYFDGRRVAMGEAMEPISIFEDARPGQKILVAVKALDTVDAKHFAAANLKIAFAPGRPAPDVVRAEAVSAEYLLPALAQSPEALKKDQAVLEAAVDAVDVTALSAGSQAVFDASLRTAQQQLEALRPLLAGAQYHLTGDAHIDAAWVWPWTETVDVVRRTFGTALQLMREYPAYTFSQSAAAYYAWMAEKYPAMDREIAARVHDGRWEVVGGMWVEPDLNLPDGESIVRQLLLGTRFFRQQYGAQVHVGWNPDSFGYTWQLPQIYKKSGIDFFVTQKMDWNETNRLPLKLFYWQSPDGSRVLTYFPHNYTNYIEPVRLAEDFNVAREENPGAAELLHLYGIGDHGGGPTRSMLDAAARWMQPDKVSPPANFGTAEAFFREIAPKIDSAHMPVWNYAALAAGAGKLPRPAPGKVSVPVWNDELYLEYTRGVYTSQAAEKRNLRRSEVWMTDAERWSSMDWLAGAAYPTAALNEAWQKVLFNQFHDIAAGSSTGVVYKDAQRDYDDVRLVTASLQQTALADLAAAVDTRPARAGEVPLMVWNALGWPRTGVADAVVQLPEPAPAVEIVDERGALVPSQSAQGHVEFLASDVPSLGYRIYFARAARSEAAHVSMAHASAGRIELKNDALRVSIDAKTGCIVELADVKTGYNAIAPGGCGNQLQSFADQPKDYDAWNIDAAALDHAEPLLPDSVTLAEDGPLRASVRIAYTWRSSKIVQTVSLTRGMDTVDVASEIDWHERHTLLKAAVPLAASGPQATFETAYGSIERPTTRNNSWEAAKFEVPALRWADLGNGTGDAAHGLSLLNDSKYGYDAKGNVLRLSLLRSPTSPDAEADQGAQHFAYALYPHAGGWKQAETVRRGYAFNDPLQAEQVAAHPGTEPKQRSFVSLAPRNLVLSAVKKTEDGDGLLLRFYEWAGDSGTATLTLPPGATAATQTDLMERPFGPALAVKNNSVEVPFTPYSILTVRVDFRPR
jgi:alpha-mannosidase